MTGKQATRLIATSFIIAVALIAWRSIRQQQAPPPGAFVFPTALYGGAALIADLGAPGFGAVLSLALTVGVFFRVVELGGVGYAPTTSSRPRASTRLRSGRRSGRAGQSRRAAK